MVCTSNIGTAGFLVSSSFVNVCLTVLRFSISFHYDVA